MDPKITDMSLAKLVVGHTFTTCGAPTYMAPEVLAGMGHHRAADWWSLGVLVFELLAGCSPFDHEHRMEIYSKVLRGIARVELPEPCLGPAGDLITALLQPVAVDRLPMRQGGINNVMNHEWFSSFDWAAMRTQSLTPPYVPALETCPGDLKSLANVDSRVLLEGFSTQREPLPAPVEYRDDMSGWDDEFAT